MVANVVNSYCIWTATDSQYFRSYSRLSRAGLRTFVSSDTGSVGLSSWLVSIEFAVVEHKREAILTITDISLGLLRRIQEIEATLAAASWVISRVGSVLSNTLANIHTFTRVSENTAYFAAYLAISILESSWLTQPALIKTFLALFRVVGARWTRYWLESTCWAVMTFWTSFTFVVFEESRLSCVGFSIACVTCWTRFTLWGRVGWESAGWTGIAFVLSLVFRIVYDFKSRPTVERHFNVITANKFIFDVARDRLRAAAWTVAIHFTRCHLKIDILITVKTSWTSNLSFGIFLTVLTRRTRNRLSWTLWAVFASGTGTTVNLTYGASAWKICSWLAFLRLGSALWAIVARGAFTIGQVGDCVVLTWVALWTLSTLVLEDAFVPRRICSWWALVDVSLVNNLAAHNRAPVTLWAGIIIVRAPLANVAGLAATTVRDLTLCCLNTHSLKWATNRIQNSFWTVESFRALANWWIRDRI